MKNEKAWELVQNLNLLALKLWQLSKREEESKKIHFFPHFFILGSRKTLISQLLDKISKNLVGNFLDKGSIYLQAKKN